MAGYTKISVIGGLLVASALPAGSEEKTGVSLWRDPVDMANRDLTFGAGGEQRAPGKDGYEFVEEDLGGVSPKYVVKDSGGLKWKVKVGEEARPETVATRLVWAVGYSTDEDYFVPSMRVEKMPKQVRRGREFVSPDGTIRDARWERMDQKKLGEWKWINNPFNKTRELGGLRVLMAMLNNYDMKDSQNSVFEGEGVRECRVGDLGATFGQSGSRWPKASKKGDFEQYRQSAFITKVTGKYVNFAAPAWPMMLGVIPTPPVPYPLLSAPMKLFGRSPAPDVAGQRWIGKGVPLEHARWMGALLGKLSAKQIRDAFRAAHYSPEEVEDFSRAVEKRIAELKAL